MNASQAMALLGLKYAGIVDRLLYGDRRPGLELALNIEKHFSIPPASWHAAPKKPFDLPEALRVA